MDNSYVTFGERLFKLNRGIPTGTNCAPELTNLYLCYYELTYFHRQLKIWDTLPKLTYLKDILMIFGLLDQVVLCFAYTKDQGEMVFIQQDLN